MLRIDEAKDVRGSGVVLRLEGKLMGRWLEELRIAATAVFERAESLTLDLSGLSFADRAGTRLLGTLVARGARLRSCSPFAAAQLRDAGIDFREE